MATDASLRTGYNKSQTDTLLAAKVSTADIGNAETAAGAALNAANDVRYARDRVDSSASQALQAFYAALANRDNEPCVIVNVGDSITEGASATSNEKRWTSRMRDVLRAHYPSATVGAGGGFGHLPPYYDGTSMGQPYTSLSGTTPSKDSTFGWGRRCARLTSSATGMTFTVTGTSVDLCYVQANSATSFTYSIDGGSAVAVNIASGLGDGHRTHVSLGASASHTIQIAWASGTNVYFTGIMVYDGDEDKGIHVIESGHYGWKTSDWTTSATYWTANFTAQPAHLVNIALMANDYQAGVSSATAKANIASMISAIRAKHSTSPSFVITLWHQRGDVASPSEPWSNYVDAAYEIAADDTGGPGGVSGVTVFDAGRRLADPGSDGSGDPFGLVAGDRVHLTDIGHALAGDAFAGFLAPR